MILLVEIQCKDWEHTSVNAGMIRLLRKAFPDEKIIFYAEEKHINCVREITNQCQIEFETKCFKFVDWRKESVEKTKEYQKLLETIVAGEVEVGRMMILSCNKGIMLAINQLARKYPTINFYLVLHSALEDVFHKISLFDYCYQKFYHLLHEKRWYKTISMKNCMNSCNMPNCHFIIYSPCYKEALQGIIKRNIVDKIIFIHHPYYDYKGFHEKICSKKINIGIYGQAVNEDAYRIVECYNEKYDNGRICFKIVAREDNPILSLKNTNRLFESNYVSGEELRKAIQNMDYILIPYNKNQYRVTASGIFWDAVSQEIPLLMLDSPYFNYYAERKVGIIEESIDDMALCISQLEREKYGLFSRNEKEMKQYTFMDNVKKLQLRLK